MSLLFEDFCGLICDYAQSLRHIEKICDHHLFGFIIAFFIQSGEPIYETLRVKPIL